KLLCLAMMLLAVVAVAQEPKAPRDDLDPAVNTSAPAPAPAPAATPAAGSGAKPAPDAATATNKPAAKPAQGKGKAKDYLDLDSTQITGNRELPKVLYIVPWRSAELGDLVGRPVNSLLDE